MVAMAVLALVPESVRTEWPFTLIVVLTACFGFVFAILSPVSLNEYRWTKSKAEQYDLIWRRIKPALRERSDAWWKVAGNARGRTNPTDLLNMFASCGEISGDNAIRRILDALCDPAAYGNREQERGKTKLRAVIWRPKPLDWLEQADPMSVNRCRQQLGHLYDLQVDFGGQASNPDRGFFVWNESEGNRKYVLASRCFSGDKSLYGFTTKHGYLNEVAAQGSLMSELWNRPVTEGDPFVSAAVADVADRVKERERQLGQRDAQFGLSHGAIGSLVLVRFNRHNTPPRRSPRRDLLGVLAIYADNPRFFQADDAETIVNELDLVLSLLQLLAGESDSMGVINRKAGADLPKIDRLRFGNLLLHAGAHERDIEHALLVQKTHGLRTQRLGQIYIETSQDPERAARLAQAERYLQPTAVTIQQPSAPQ